MRGSIGPVEGDQARMEGKVAIVTGARNQRQRDFSQRRRHADVGRGRPALRQVAGSRAGRDAARHGKQVPFGRFGKPEDLTGIAVFLPTSDSDYMLGQTVNVDGGRVMK